MAKNAVIYGAGGGVVGLLIGLFAGSGGPSQEDISAAVSGAMGPAQEASASAAAASSDALAALDSRLTAIEEGLAANAPDMEGLQSALSEDLGAAVEGLRGALSDEIAASAKAQNETIRAALAQVSEGMQESARVAAAAVAAAAPGGTGEAGAAPAGAATVSDALGVGRTALFADGKVRVFVSRIDPAGGSAVLSIGGTAVTLGSGGSAKVALNGGACTVSVMALTEQGVTLGSDCDAAAEAPEAEEAANVAPEDGVKPGNAIGLADGGLRVFVASLNEADATARIAINGVQTYVVASGQSVEVESGDQTCTVTVTGVGNGMVGLEGSCG